MPKLRVGNFTISLDGYGSGPHQTREAPLGVGGERLHGWAFATRHFRAAHGMEGGAEGIDNDYAAAGDAGIGATIMGRNMFGPPREGWDPATEGPWEGWWGPEPPFHHPVFVLTHHEREPVEMEGGTTFHFVTDGIESALEQAFAASGGQDVKVAGGAGTIRQYLRAGLVDELQIVISPVFLGGGERLLEDMAGYECVDMVGTPSATHVRIVRSA